MASPTSRYVPGRSPSSAASRRNGAHTSSARPNRTSWIAYCRWVSGSDGRAFTIVKVYYEPRELEAALAQAGFVDARVTTTGRFFLTGVAIAGN